MTEKNTQTASSSQTSGNGHAKRPDASAPWTVGFGLFKDEVERFQAEGQKAIERNFVEAERAMNEGYRLASAQMSAAREMTRMYQDAVKKAFESFQA
jgi:hypothetical protein